MKERGWIVCIVSLPIQVVLAVILVQMFMFSVIFGVALLGDEWRDTDRMQDLWWEKTRRDWKRLGWSVPQVVAWSEEPWKTYLEQRGTLDI